MDLQSRNIYTDDVTDFDCPITSQSKKSLNKSPTTTTPRDKILLWKRPRTHLHDVAASNSSGANMSPFKWSGKTIITQAKIGTGAQRANRFYLTVCPDQQCSAAPSAGLKKTTINVLILEKKKTSCREKEEEIMGIISTIWPTCQGQHVASFLWKVGNFPTIMSGFQPGPTHARVNTGREKHLRLPGTNIPPPQIKR